jgi:outer membrane lipoprotein-sorting protein
LNLILSSFFCALMMLFPGQADQRQLAGVLAQIDSKSNEIVTLNATFRQVKHSDILRRPLVSSGVVRMLKDRVRWDTEAPHPSVLMATKDDVRIYYPDLSVLEIYALSDQLSQLAGSPVFRLSEIKRHFAIESDLEDTKSGLVFLTLIPREEELRKHLKSIRLGVHVKTGVVRQAVIRNTDDEKTEMFFDDIRINLPMDSNDLQMVLPVDVETIHPLGDDRSKVSSVESDS